MHSPFTGLERHRSYITDMVMPDRSLFASDMERVAALGDTEAVRDVMQLASWASQPAAGRDPSELWFPFPDAWRAWATLRRASNSPARLRVSVFADRSQESLFGARMMGVETKTNCGLVVQPLRNTTPDAMDQLARTPALRGPRGRAMLWGYFKQDVPTPQQYTPKNCAIIVMDLALDQSFSSPHTRVEGWLPANPYLLVHHLAHVFAPLMRDALGWTAASSAANPPNIVTLPATDRLKTPRTTQAGLDFLISPEAIHERELRLDPRTPRPLPLPGHVKLHDLDAILPATAGGTSKFPSLIRSTTRWVPQTRDLILSRGRAKPHIADRAMVAVDFARQQIINDPMCVTEPEALEYRALQHAHDVIPDPISNPQV
ncbi:MAG: hypothetical protein DI640_13165 [Sphingomonas taxi]|uniref:Uncharacterized protein n=1 Tax=Sphingomonas taxi TaxID=1549858 RepID=A0A2W5AW14_9SPHN|nr:MAG: hypothetical protein DI640_13165 [Sphingomonas taxi]